MDNESNLETLHTIIQPFAIWICHYQEMIARSICILVQITKTILGGLTRMINLVCAESNSLIINIEILI